MVKLLILTSASNKFLQSDQTKVNHCLVKLLMLHSHLHLPDIEAHWIITSSFITSNTIDALQDTPLKTIIKGSFTENFHPPQAFFSDEIKNFSSYLYP